VVVSGGARGVTAETVIALGAHTGARFLLLGRSPLETEPAEVASVEGYGELAEPAIKGALMRAAMARGERPAPAAIGKAAAKISACREIRDTLARLGRVGSEAIYEAVDVVDGPAIAALLDRVRPSWGPVKGLIHGAGVIQDRLIADKTDAQLQLVLQTKISGLRALLSATENDPLSVILAFSSVAARCGNRGQVDYAMANEHLNASCWAEAQRRPGCLVRALGWGPWAGGMVTPSLKARFDALGVPLIPLEVGAAMLVAEVMDPTGPAAVVLGGEPKPEALLADSQHKDGAAAASAAVSLQRRALSLSPELLAAPWLADHQVDGRIVVPMVYVAEWMLRAAHGLHPDLPPAPGAAVGRAGPWTVEGLAALKGLVLDPAALPALSLQVTEGLHTGEDGALHTALDMLLVDGDGRPRYKARLRRGPGLRAPATVSGLPDWAGPLPYASQSLFHGPALQVLEPVTAGDARGLRGALRGAAAQGWPEATRAALRSDLPAMDGALQLALLWTEAALGGPSLPLAVGGLTLAHAGCAPGGLQASLSAVEAKGDRARCDVQIYDQSGAVYAILTDIQTFVRRAAAR
jgi:hypothetical protein